MTGTGRTRSGTARRPWRGFPDLLLLVTSVLATILIARGIWDSYRGPDLARQRLAERRGYYEHTLRGANLSFSEALFWEGAP